MPALLDNEDCRKYQVNANYATMIALDVDGGMTIEQAMVHPYIMTHCGIAIESASSSPAVNKFRLVFPLAEPVEGWQNIKTCNTYLAHLVGSADPACKDASRFFYGSPGRKPFWLQDATLPADFLTQALGWAAAIEAKRLAKEAQAKAERLARIQEIEAHGGFDLVGALELAEQRLGFDAFAVELEPRATGHKQRCKPAFRVGSGSFSAFLSERGGVFLYCDPAADHKAMSGFRFFTAQRHGVGYQARGQEWIRLAREFCALAGVTIPETLPSLKPKSDNPVDLDKWRADVAARARAKWLQRRKFTPTVTLDSPRLPAIPRGDVAIKSGLGSGKTYQLAAKMQSQGGGAIMLGSRNGLLLQTVERLNQGAAHFRRFTHIHSPEMGLWQLIAPHGRVALCLDSLTRFKDPNHLDGKTLILDEATSTVKHLLLGGTLAGKRAKVEKLFAEAVARAGEVVALDGNLNDTVLEYLEALRGKPIQRLENTSQPVSMDVFITVNPDKPRDHSGVLGNLIKSLGKGDRCVLVSDSQRLCEAMDDALTERGNKVFRVDSKTMADPEFQQMIRDPNLGEALVKAGIDCLILSPSAESGLDVSALEVLDGKLQGYFSLGYAVFYGILDTDSQTQILRRAREVTQWLIHCPEYSMIKSEGSRSSFEGTLGRSLIEAISLELSVAAMDGGDTSEWVKDLEKCPHHTARIKLMAQRNHEAQHTRECLKLALESQGHRVEIVGVECDPEIEQLVKAIRRAIIMADAKSIFNATPITADHARALKSRFSSSLEQRWQVERALLLEKLPGVEDTENWTVGLVKACLFTDRNLIRKLQNYWLTQHLDLAENRTRKRIQAVIDGHTVLADLGTGLSKLKFLSDLGIPDLIGGGRGYAADHPIIQGIWERVRRSRKAKALGIAPGHNATPMQWIGRMIRDTFGGTSTSVQSGEGERDRTYRYQRSKHSGLEQFIAVFLAEKFSDQTRFSDDPQTQTGQGFEGEHTPAISRADIEPGCVRVQTQSGQGFEASRENEFDHTPDLTLSAPDPIPAPIPPEGDVAPYQAPLYGAIAWFCRVSGQGLYFPPGADLWLPWDIKLPPAAIAPTHTPEVA